jgi:hypothetical protein
MLGPCLGHAWAMLGQLELGHPGWRSRYCGGGPHGNTACCSFSPLAQKIAYVRIDQCLDHAWAMLGQLELGHPGAR